MALTLGAKVGDVFDVATRWIAVRSVASRSRAIVIRDDGQKFTVSSHHMTEIAPDVWIGLGPYSPRYKLRLVFDAPRHIPILRRNKERVEL